MTEIPASRLVASALWRRLDVPGHDACELRAHDGGWRLEGTSVFRHGPGAARLDYAVECDGAWRTVRGAVRGSLDGARVDLVVERTPDGVWTLGGAPQPGLEHLVDLDLGFTPATNLLQLRRIALAVGDGADVPVAWLDVDRDALSELPQRYERRSARGYRYASPTAGYEATLEVDEHGFVRRYPDLWEAEA